MHPNLRRMLDAFRYFDPQHSGTIAQEAFLQQVKQLSGNVPAVETLLEQFSSSVYPDRVDYNAFIAHLDTMLERQAGEKIKEMALQRYRQHQSPARDIRSPPGFIEPDEDRSQNSARNNKVIEIPIRNLFTEIDTNRNGLVTYSEVYSALVSGGVQIPVSEYKMLYYGIDQDGKGFLNLQEFAILVDQIHAREHKDTHSTEYLFRCIDRNSDEFISYSDLQESHRGLNSDSIPLQLFNKFSDPQGFLDFSKFNNLLEYMHGFIPKHVISMFYDIDTAGRGLASFNDLVSGLRKRGATLSRSQFNKIDKFGEGYLDLYQFVDLVDDLRETPKRTRMQYSTNLPTQSKTSPGIDYNDESNVRVEEIDSKPTRNSFMQNAVKHVQYQHTMGHQDPAEGNYKIEDEEQEQEDNYIVDNRSISHSSRQQSIERGRSVSQNRSSPTPSSIPQSDEFVPTSQSRRSPSLNSHIEVEVDYTNGSHQQDVVVDNHNSRMRSFTPNSSRVSYVEPVQYQNQHSSQQQNRNSIQYEAIPQQDVSRRVSSEKTLPEASYDEVDVVGGQLEQPVRGRVQQQHQQPHQQQQQQQPQQQQQQQHVVNNIVPNEIKILFQDIDTNSDGVVTYEEVFNTISKRGLLISEQEYDLQFGRVDQHANGFINAHQFSSLWMALVSFNERGISSSTSGILKKSIIKLKPIAAKLLMQCSELDTSRNGAVSVKLLRDIAKQNNIELTDYELNAMSGCKETLDYIKLIGLLMEAENKESTQKPQQSQSLSPSGSARSRSSPVRVTSPVVSSQKPARMRCSRSVKIALTKLLGPNAAGIVSNALSDFARKLNVRPAPPPGYIRSQDLSKVISSLYRSVSREPVKSVLQAAVQIGKTPFHPIESPTAFEAAAQAAAANIRATSTQTLVDYRFFLAETRLMSQKQVPVQMP